MLLADVLPDDQCDSATEGRDMPCEATVPPVAPTAPVEFLVLDLISSAATDHLSEKEATELRLLLVDECGEGMSADSRF